MSDVRLRWLLQTQEDLVSWWQLRALGWSRRSIEARAWRHGWRELHQGVYGLRRSPVTRRQLWMAAVLTEPATVLGAASAGAMYGFRPWEGGFETVVRHGSGGPQRYGDLVVMRSSTLAPDITWFGGIPVTTPERTLIDLAPHLSPWYLAKATREAIRLGRITALSLREALGRHRGRRGTAQLRVLADRYEHLPIGRARSDAESYALERLFLAGAPIPALNVKVGGVEADLVDHDRKLIVEIDGGQFHMFADVDAEKESAWEAAGYTVERLPSDVIFRR